MKSIERIVFCVIIVLLTILNLDARKYTKRLKQVRSHEMLGLSAIYNYIRQLEFESEHFEFGKDQYFYVERGDSVNLLDWNCNSKLFVFLYEYSCQPCTDSLINCLKEVFSSTSQEITFLGTPNSIRLLQPIFEKFDVNYPTLIAREGELPIVALQNTYSFLCTIDHGLETQFVHIPDKGDTKRTLNYLSFIKSQVLTKNGDPN